MKAKNETPFARRLIKEGSAAKKDVNKKSTRKYCYKILVNKGHMGGQKLDRVTGQ